MSNTGNLHDRFCRQIPGLVLVVCVVLQYNYEDILPRFDGLVDLYDARPSSSVYDLRQKRGQFPI